MRSGFRGKTSGWQSPNGTWYEKGGKGKERRPRRVCGARAGSHDEFEHTLKMLQKKEEAGFVPAARRRGCT